MVNGRLKVRRLGLYQVLPYMSRDKEKHAAYMREWLKRTGGNKYSIRKERQNAYVARNRVKTNARALVRYHLKAGNIVRLPCEVCGCPKSEAHHPDHTKALEVQWLCRPHHMRQHDHSYSRKLNLSHA